MLIELTRKCNEMCTHCMVDATPDGPHMSLDIFKNALDFAVFNKIKAISITGGEPTLHPEFFKFMRFMLNKLGFYECGILLESNGWWINNDDMKTRISKLLEHPCIIKMQISTSKKYYPNYEKIMSHQKDFESLSEKIFFTHDWQGVDTHLKYMGRAKNIMKKEDATGLPNCMNFVSYALNFSNLGIPKLQHNISTLCNFALLRGKLCAPEIKVNGDISICEGSCAPVLISLKDWKPWNNVKLSQELFYKILSFVPCNQCGTFKNMSKEQCEAFDKYRAQLGLEPKFMEKWEKLI